MPPLTAHMLQLYISVAPSIAVCIQTCESSPRVGLGRGRVRSGREVGGRGRGRGWSGREVEGGEAEGGEAEGGWGRSGRGEGGEEAEGGEVGREGGGGVSELTGK